MTFSNEVEILGIKTHRNLSFSSHINIICRRRGRKLGGPLKGIKKFFRCKSKEVEFSREYIFDNSC